MDVWDKQLQEDRHGRHRKQNPSFSSSLLDAIYRSIDESNGDEREEQVILYRETMRKKQSIGFEEDEDDRLNFRRACMIEKWMEKKVSEKVVVRRSSMVDFDRKARNVRDRDFKKLMNSSSSSSESSSGGGFSSSESETRSSPYTMQRPRPIRTEKPQFEKPKNENGFVKTKSKALKIYGDLKKVKQPISPGGRLATFLNSLFNGGSPKKQKFTNSDKQNDACMRKSKSSQGSTCSSASSFSRSCLSKTPSSSEKLINSSSTKRSVRFCPVSVILDEDSRPCGHKSLQDELGLMAAATTLRNAIRNDHCRAEEASKDLMNSFQKKINDDVYINRELEEEDDDDDDEDEDDDEDAASCSSSDLFELDNLSSIGIERYREELPVYETTHFSTNQAIADGLIL
ncbi:Protein BIG GRAIN 1-like A, partial [Cucurbita argyrosperma subsp. argyrosperma]